MWKSCEENVLKSTNLTVISILNSPLCTNIVIYCWYIGWTGWFSDGRAPCWRPFRWRSGVSGWSPAGPSTSPAPPVCPVRAAGTAGLTVWPWDWRTLHPEETAWGHSSSVRPGTNCRLTYVSNKLAAVDLLRWVFSFVTDGVCLYFLFFSTTRTWQAVAYRNKSSYIKVYWKQHCTCAVST